ncbi:CTB family bacteriocin [Nostoc sp. UHCC 0302]|uniref:CTB family bacteriocin n=1 Tax=Nostoc sp. UHCC 0302 TaxID=3134896 RepID=UPI00311CD4C1
MSHPIIASKLFVELSDEQQELLAGGTDVELSNTKFKQKQIFLQGTTFSGPQGSSANSQGNSTTLRTSAKDLLGLGINTPGRVSTPGRPRMAPGTATETE